MKDDVYYFKFDAKTWLSKASKIQVLTFAEKGLFVELCSLCLLNHGSVEDNDFLSRKLSLDKQTFSEMKQALISASVLLSEDGKLSVKFINEQLCEMAEKSQINAVNGRTGGLRTKRKKANAKRTLSESAANHEPLTINHEQEDKKDSSSLKKNAAAGSSQDYPQTADEIITKAVGRGYLMSIEEALRFLSNFNSTGWQIDGKPVREWWKLLDGWKARQAPAQRAAAIKESQRRKQGLPAVEDAKLEDWEFYTDSQGRKFRRPMGSTNPDDFEQVGKCAVL